MKKMLLMFVCAVVASASAFASDYYKATINTCDEAQMRAALDKAAYTNRSVVTIIECENGVVKTKTMPKPKCNTCNACNTCEPKEEVVKREYFVRETVQQYKPVVQYVPSGTYTRVRPTCNHGC